MHHAERIFGKPDIGKHQSSRQLVRDAARHQAPRTSDRRGVQKTKRFTESMRTTFGPWVPGYRGVSGRGAAVVEITSS